MFPFFYWGRILFRFMLCPGLTAISLVGLMVFFFFETLFTSTIFPNESSLALRIFGFIFFLSVLGHVFVKESWFLVLVVLRYERSFYGIFSE